MKFFVLFCLVLLISADSGRGSWVDNDDEDCQRAAGEAVEDIQTKDANARLMNIVGCKKQTVRGTNVYIDFTTISGDATTLWRYDLYHNIGPYEITDRYEVFHWKDEI